MVRQRRIGRRCRAIFLSGLLCLGGWWADWNQVSAAGQIPEELVPVGHTIGMKLFSEGVVVVGLAEVEGLQGASSPGAECGLRVGDVIDKVGETDVESSEQFAALIQCGGVVELSVSRGDEDLKLQAKPNLGEDGTYRLGAWIRDSMAGIGTVTFYNPATGLFGALGHGITDVDTGLLMPLGDGAVMDSTVKAVKRGSAGEPGELRGSFNLTEDRGSLHANTECGVFGVMKECAMTEGAAVPVAKKEQVTTGPAVILSNVSGDTVKEYTIEIIRFLDASPTQNLLIRVTDPALLKQTGGIVQGMSGSPILQNGRIVGAVTHVLVNDPTKGYGIFIENMLNASE